MTIYQDGKGIVWVKYNEKLYNLKELLIEYERIRSIQESN